MFWNCRKAKPLYLENYAKFVCSGIWCKVKNSDISVNLVGGRGWAVLLWVAVVWFRDVQCGWNVAPWPAQADCNLAAKRLFAILLQDKYFPIKTVSAQFVFSLWRTLRSHSLVACLLCAFAAPWGRVPLRWCKCWACESCLPYRAVPCRPRPLPSGWAPLELFLLLT